MSALALYNDAVSKAYYGHLGWGLNLGIQYYVGHNQLAPWAVNIAMVPCAVLHLACAWGVYGRGSASAVKTYNKVSPFLNAFLFTFTIALEVVHTFGIGGVDMRDYGLADYEHGVYCVTLAQLAVNLGLYALMFAGEIPLITGAVSALEDKNRKKKTPSAPSRTTTTKKSTKIG